MEYCDDSRKGKGEPGLSAEDQRVSKTTTVIHIDVTDTRQLILSSYVLRNVNASCCTSSVMSSAWALGNLFLAL